MPMSDLFGVAGQQLLAELRLDPAYHARVVSLRRLIDALDFEIDIVAKRTAARLAADAGYRAVQTIDGVGPVLAAIFVAEIGDVHRFTSSRSQRVQHQQVVTGQPQAARRDVVQQMIDVASARDCHHMRAALQRPGDPHLCLTGAVGTRDLGDHVISGYATRLARDARDREERCERHTLFAAESYQLSFVSRR